MSPISIFEGVAPDRVYRLRQQATERQFRRVDTVYGRGEPSSEVLAITVGRVKIWRGLENGVVITLGLLAAGEFVGLIGAFSGVPRNSTVTALSPVTALSWRASAIMGEMTRDPRLTFNVHQLMARYMGGVTDRMEELAARSAESRLARVLTGLTRDVGKGKGTPVCVDVTQNDLAELARTTVPTVSRCLARWRQDGVAQAQRGRVVLLNPVRLREIGCEPG